MQMVSITGDIVRVAHTSGHVLFIGSDPVEVSERIPGLIEAALAEGCMPNERLEKAVAAAVSRRRGRGSSAQEEGHEE